MVAGREVRVCGDPCRTAVETIANAGLAAWYGLRTHSDAHGAATADPRHRAEIDVWRVPEVEATLVRRAGDGDVRGGARHGSSAVILTVEGMRCAGCAWLVERLLASVPGVGAAAVDFPLRRAEVRFDARATRLHALLEALAKAGYRAVPYTAHEEEAAIESERRTRIRGLGISALFGMQVMLLSIALYASDRYGGMDAGFEQLFRWLAMMLTVPVLVWPGRTFFTGAAAALRGRRLTMDVPVALGLSIAFLGSVFATITGEGAIWFDSVVMFVTLLSGARYLELLARRRATAAIRALARSAPLVATRVREGRTDGVTGGRAGSGAANGAERRSGTERGAGNRSETGSEAASGTEGGAGNRSETGSEAASGAERRSGTERGAGNSSETGSEAGSEAGDGAAIGSGHDGGEGGAGIDRVPAAALRPGDRVRVRPGEVVPADGVIRAGHSSFDESLLTGESNPVARSPGGRVLAGSVNDSGVVEVEVTCTGDATVLGGVLRRAGQAARERPAIALLADRAAAWFIAGILVLAAGVAIGWLLHDPARTIPVLVSVLVITCPCALSLATPAAMTAALGALARAGLIATRANAVERLALATHCLADKTGTLTEGRFRLRSVVPLAAVSASRCLALAAALERYATHPAASAIVAAADAIGRRKEAVTPSGMPGSATRTPGSEDCRSGPGTGAAGPEASDLGPGTRTSDPVAHCADSVVEDARTHTGGVAGRIGGVRYAVGSAEYVARACALAAGASGADAGDDEAPPSTAGDAAVESVERPESPTRTTASESPATGRGSGAERKDERRGRDDGNAGGDRAGGGDGDRSDETGDAGTRVFLAREGVLLARFVLADTLRADAGKLIEGLRARGIETTIASGDSAGAVERAAAALGVAHHLAGLSPEDKLAEAARLAARGERVLMLGDGVNDAPALAGAHVSVAMGRGAAAAAARADAVLIGDDPVRLLAGLDVARRTRRIVKQNLAWALGYNLVALPLAAAGAVPPWAAAIGMSLSSLVVAGNALRLGRSPDAHGH